MANTTHWLSEGVSSYNGLEVDVNHRFSHGLQFRGVYTFAKALDDGDSMNTSVATNSPAFVSNPLDPLQRTTAALRSTSALGGHQRHLRSAVRPQERERRELLVARG